MRDIRASVEVRALIGAEGLRQLHEDAFVRYCCWRCGRSGWTTKPTSVTVVGRVAREAAAPVVAHRRAGDRAVVLGVGRAGGLLDRRRLAAWEAAWATVGPQWSRRFRSRG